MLGSPYNLYYDDMENSVSKSTVLETRIKHLMKETSLDSWATRNLVRRGQNIWSEISLMSKVPLKAMIDCSIYNTITKPSREEIIEWILYHTNFNSSCVLSDVVTVLNPVSKLK